MLAIAVSLLFGIAAFAALVVIRTSLVAGARHARAILAELAEIDGTARVTRRPAARSRPLPASRRALAAA